MTSKPHPPVPRWLWGLLIGSGLLFVIQLFVSRWSSLGPTIFPVDATRALTVRDLPLFLHPPATLAAQALPTLVILLICLGLPLIPSNNGTRLIMRVLFLGMMTRYFVWRTLGTLNLTTWQDGIASVLLYGIEVIGVVSLLLLTLQSLWSTTQQRRREADRYEQQVREGRYQPWVDVFVPTYNEPEFIVRRTAMGCQAMDYPHKTVYILDDTRRPHIKALAEQLGCRYITRPDNRHAKAGNLNNALPQTDGELITIMDADFVPFKNFLTRTVGFFQQADVALVQTPQTFYNPDHHLRNLGIDHLLPGDLANFFSFVQSTRDRINSVVCCGTSYVVRRQALEDVGGYYTRCVSEDSPTSTFMLTRGWRVLYFAEQLSMGESTRNYADFLKQRLRWLQGNLQIYYCSDDVPIWRTMTLAQKSCWLSLLIGCFNPLFRAIFLLAPIVSIYLGLVPYATTAAESIYYLVPYLLLLVGSFSWLNEYNTSYFYNELYETIFCFPGLQRLLFTLRSPFGKPFVVTPKGVTTDSKRYNLVYTFPLLIVIALTLVALVLHLGGYWLGHWQTVQMQGFGILFFWLLYNLMMCSLAVLAAIDQPERRLADRFPAQHRCRVQVAGQWLEGYTMNLSEGGSQVHLWTEMLDLPAPQVLLELPEQRLILRAVVQRLKPAADGFTLGLAFEERSLAQDRALIEILYTNMTWWKQAKRVSSLDTLLAMMVAFLQLRPLRRRYGS